MENDRETARLDMLVTAIEKKEKLDKNDNVVRSYTVRAKMEATKDVKFSMVFKNEDALRAAGWKTGLRFTLLAIVEQSTIQEFVEADD